MPEGEFRHILQDRFSVIKKKTCWIKVVRIQKLAEAASQYLRRGARIAVIGTLDRSKWETDEGLHKSSFQLIAISLEFIKTDGRGFKENQNTDKVTF